MNTEQKKLFEQIARCSVADDIIDDLLANGPKDKPCSAICSYQQDKINGLGDERVRFGKETFHMPEPWNGNLSKADILFVSSNPNFSIDETTPELARKKNKEVFPKFKNDEWPLEKAEDFFENRFGHEEYDNDTWKGILSYAGYLLNETDSVQEINDKEQKQLISSKIALTEIVHCKSPDETGLVKEAIETCYGKHTKDVIKLFLETSSDEPKTVVLMGSKVRNFLRDDLKSKFKNAGLKKPEDLQKRLGDYILDDLGVSDENTKIILLPHTSGRTSSWRSWKEPEKLYKLNVSKELKNVYRQQIIDSEM